LNTLLQLITEYGLWFVFVNILLQQAGVPLPGYPLLMVAGAITVKDSNLGLPSLLATGVAACLIADVIWYTIGKWAGRRVLRTLCRISLSPDGCVRQTESIFTRFGVSSLLVAKFVPGFASVATAMAGAMRIPRGRFLLFDLLGATLWVGFGLALGWVFAPAIDRVLADLVRIGEGGLIVSGAALTAYISWKWCQRHRFTQQLQMARMPVAVLGELLDRGESPLIIDVRSATAAVDGTIPGAIVTAGDPSAPALLSYPKNHPIVVYCACPNDASAVIAARKLLQRGYRDVRPLAGGIEAWIAAGRGISAVQRTSAPVKRLEPR